MLEGSIYFIYRAAITLASLFPLGFLYRLGEGCGLLAWLILPGYRGLAQRNLAIAFGQEKSPAELRTLTRQHFQRLGANLLSGIKISTMPLAEIDQLAVIENIEAVTRELKTRGVVLALSHTGNWELLALLLPKYLGHVRNATVYQRLRNSRIDADLRARRGRARVELFDRKEGFHRAVDLLRGGGVFGILSDQHAGDHGVWTPFFLRLASTTNLPALLAKRSGAALIAAAVYTAGPGRWRVAFSDPLNQPTDSINAITAKINRALEAEIRRSPIDWFWVHNRWKTPRPNFLLARYKRGIFLPPEIPRAQLQPFRILVRATNWLGDSVLCVPAVRALQASRPDAHITVAAPAKSAALWKLVAEVDTVLSLPNHSLGQTVSRLKKEPRFDVAILLPNSLRAALEVWLAGIPRRVGYAGHHRRWLLNQVAREKKKPAPLQHQALRYTRLVEGLGAPPVQANFETRAPAGKSGRLALCPGAEYGPAKRWLPERFADTARRVAEERAVTWTLLGMAADAAIGAEIEAALSGRCRNLIGKTTLEELIAELRASELLLTNDTGTMHLAAFLGVPVVAIFGSTEPKLTGPLGAGHRILRQHVECSPCFLRACPIDFRCMRAVEAEEAARAIFDHLDSAAS